MIEISTHKCLDKVRSRSVPFGPELSGSYYEPDKKIIVMSSNMLKREVLSGGKIPVPEMCPDSWE